MQKRQVTLRQRLCLHKWDGCTCEKCGRVRDKDHDFDYSCTCNRCGTVADSFHLWDGCTCRTCGTVRDERHDWDGDTCRICGKRRDQGKLQYL